MKFKPRVFGYEEFLLESAATIDWDGLEAWCAENRPTLPDCIPTNVKEWESFKKQYETAKPADFKKSPKECAIDLDDEQINKFKSFGVDLPRFVQNEVRGIVLNILKEPVDELPNFYETEDPELQIVNSYVHGTSDVIGLGVWGIVLSTLLDADRLDLIYPHCNLFNEGDPHRDAFFRFLGYNLGEIYKDDEIPQKDFNDMVMKSGKTAKEIKKWLIDDGYFEYTLT